MAGPCSTNKTKEQLKKEFEAKLKDNVMIKYLFCTHSQCEVTDIEVTCTQSRKRSIGTLKIEFDIITEPDKPPVQPVAAMLTFSNVQDLKRIEDMLKKQIEATIKRLQSLLKQLENQVLYLRLHYRQLRIQKCNVR